MVNYINVRNVEWLDIVQSIVRNWIGMKMIIENAAKDSKK